MINPRSHAVCPVCRTDWRETGVRVRFNVLGSPKGGQSCTHCRTRFYDGGDPALFQAKVVQFRRLWKRFSDGEEHLATREPTTVEGKAMLYQQAIACALLAERFAAWLDLQGRRDAALALEEFAWAVRRPYTLHKPVPLPRWATSNRRVRKDPGTTSVEEPPTGEGIRLDPPQAGPIAPLDTEEEE